jgi:Excreted virulence factor EspC, type VII ESX diderm
MRNEFSVDVDEMRRASEAAAEAADLVEKVQLLEALEPVGHALPGSRTARGVEILSATWRKQLTAWSRDADRYATSIRTAADAYVASDEQAAADLRASGSPLAQA